MTYARSLWIRPDNSKTYTGLDPCKLNHRYQPCDVPSVPIETTKPQSVNYSELIEQAQVKPDRRKSFSGIASLQPPSPKKRSGPKSVIGAKILELIQAGPRQIDELCTAICPIVGTQPNVVYQTVCKMARAEKLIKIGHWAATNETDPAPLMTRPALPPAESNAGRVLAVLGREPIEASVIAAKTGLSIGHVRASVCELQRRNCAVGTDLGWTRVPEL